MTVRLIRERGAGPRDRGHSPEEPVDAKRDHQHPGQNGDMAAARQGAGCMPETADGRLGPFDARLSEARARITAALDRLGRTWSG